jgi:outer membrane protein TolC
MRCKQLVGGLALILAVIAGCKQQCFLTEYDYNHYRDMAGLPKDLDCNPTHGSIIPNVAGKMIPEPATIFNPERPIRYLTLAEAFAMALENGTIGTGVNSSAGGLAGRVNDGFSGNSFQSLRQQYGPLGWDNIRVWALQPAVVATDIDSALSKFDARFQTSLNWLNGDGYATPAWQQSNLGSQVQGVGSTVGNTAEFKAGLIKDLPSGGQASVNFNTDYSLIKPAFFQPQFNPAYRSSLYFSFSQPLLQFFGVEINQLLHYAPLTGPQLNHQATEGILLTRIRFDQSRAVFEAMVSLMLADVEIAYWNLYGAYGRLFTQEIALRQNLMVWRVTKVRVEAGVKGYNQADLYEALGQYETSRSEWLRYLGEVLEAERNLRGLLGLPVEDGCRLVPCDAPTMAPFQPDWCTCLEQALTLKPELVVAREQVKATQLYLILQKNQLLPDLLFNAGYELYGLGSRLDGNGAAPLSSTDLFVPDNAFRSLASNHFNNWNIGLTLRMPLGFRDAHAGVRATRLKLAQAYWALRTEEDKAQRFLAKQYREVLQFQRQIEINRAAVEAFNNDLNVRYERVKSGQELAVDTTLNSIRFGTQAMLQYYTFIANYNSALASLEWIKGTLLQRNNVVIAEGPLPACAQVRAVEHERQRSKALELRQRAAPPGALPDGAPSVLMPLPGSNVVSLPELMQSQPELPKELYERIPPPKPSQSETITPLSFPAVPPATRGPSTGTVPVSPSLMTPSQSPSSFDKITPLSLPAVPPATRGPTLGTVTFPVDSPARPSSTLLPSLPADNKTPRPLPNSLSGTNTIR